MLKQEAIGPAAPSAPRARSPVVLWLSGAVVVLAVAVIGLGAALVAPTVTRSPTTALVDRMIGAWNVFDGDTIRSLYADDSFVFASSGATPAAKGIDEVVSLAQWGGFSIERLGPVTERATLTWFPAHVSTTYDVSGSDAVVVLRLRDGKITQHWVIWNE